MLEADVEREERRVLARRGVTHDLMKRLQVVVEVLLKPGEGANFVSLPLQSEDARTGTNFSSISHCFSKNDGDHSPAVSAVLVARIRALVNVTVYAANISQQVTILLWS